MERQLARSQAAHHWLSRRCSWLASTCSKCSASVAGRCAGPRDRTLRLDVQARRTVSSRTETRQQQQRQAVDPADPPPSGSGKRGRTGGPRPPPRGQPQPWTFADGTLLLGDIVMLTATEVSSERIPLEALPLLTGVTVLCWVAAAAALGDYRGEMPTSDDWTLSILGPSFMSVLDTTLTWGISTVASAVVFSVLVGIRALDASIMVEALGAEELAPQLEVAVAALITMSCFRGIVARLRWR